MNTNVRFTPYLLPYVDTVLSLAMTRRRCAAIACRSFTPCDLQAFAFNQIYTTSTSHSSPEMLLNDTLWEKRIFISFDILGKIPQVNIR